MSINHRLMLPALAFAALALTTNAQEQQIRVNMAHGENSVGLGPGTFQFVTSEMAFNDKTVKGAPYSADAVTETTQTLADGNRIVHSNTSHVYRDSMGRIRREQSLKAIGPWTADGAPPTFISIVDPVAGTAYTLHPNDKTADRMNMMMLSTGVNQRMMTIEKSMSPGKVNFAYSTGTAESAKTAKPVTEQLGSQVIEGVSADGTRSTTTIPAGQIGNERDINIVSETWYSPELQTVVMSKRTDPMNGETVFRLTNINRAEPPASLFQVPEAYTIDEPKGNIMIRRSAKPEE